MKNTNTATSGQTGQFPPITQEDYQRLKGIIRDNETDYVEPEEFAEIHAELTDRYGKDHIKEATTRAKDELEAEAEKDLKHFTGRFNPSTFRRTHTRKHSTESRERLRA